MGGRGGEPLSAYANGLLTPEAGATHCWTEDELMWIYVLGERGGGDVKIGHSDKPTVGERLRVVDREQMTDDSYVLLASMLGPQAAENAIKRTFAPHLRPKGKRTEYFYPVDEIVEWVVWLRQQWWTCFDPNTEQTGWVEEHYSNWVPANGRIEKLPALDPLKIVQDHEQTMGPLAGTAWSLLPDPLATFQDYFTPPEIVARAAEAMGGIDIDVASHWIANRRFHEAGIFIGDYFHVNRSAFEHEWVGNCWLNPPYGENERWFTRAREMFDLERLKQLCMLSPIYAFTTGVAEEMMQSAEAAVLLSPTPRFFNPGEPDRTGTNLPHAIFYWGDRRREFFTAFAGAGIPLTLAWQRVAA